MKLKTLLSAALLFLLVDASFAQYNTLVIPDTLSGTTFNLALRDTFKQFLPGNQTITGGINGNFWGPTLIFNQGDTVHMNVHSYMNDSTTLHWHGMHLPAVMDGGPHQIIPPGTVWQPYWLVKNQAATYWYHPHLHQMAEQQMTSGLGGFIIVRDAAESALALPRTYGVDDIPLALTSRNFDAANAFLCCTRAYGDTAMVNGTLHPQVTLPKQYVRFRILNAEMERGYNLGFSDNRSFYIIGNDGGLLNAPSVAARIKLLPGERAEIMVDLGSDAIGSSLDMVAYNAGQEFGFGGGEPNSTGNFGSLLNNRNFNVLHIVVASTTAGAITAVPTSLVSNTYLTAADATVNRTLAVTDGAPGGAPFQFDHKIYNFDTINKTVALGTTEKWTVINNNVFGHAFHIHDVEFKLLSRSSHSLGAYESGWKDVFYLQVGDTVSFVARFNDYADAIHPFMYHCHFAPHEDGGMMQQFVVVDATGVSNVEKPSGDFTLYPNPAKTRINFSFTDPAMQVYYVTITNSVGRTMCMLPRPQLGNGIDISAYAPGVYFVQLTDEKTKAILTKQFIKE